MHALMRQWFQTIQRKSTNEPAPAILAVGCGFLSPISLWATAPKRAAYRGPRHVPMPPKVELLYIGSTTRTL